MGVGEIKSLFSVCQMLLEYKSDLIASLLPGLFVADEEELVT